MGGRAGFLTLYENEYYSSNNGNEVERKIEEVVDEAFRRETLEW